MSTPTAPPNSPALSTTTNSNLPTSAPLDHAALTYAFNAAPPNSPILSPISANHPPTLAPLDTDVLSYAINAARYPALPPWWIYRFKTRYTLVPGFGYVEVLMPPTVVRRD